MRKSSVLLGGISFVAVFGATTGWLMRAEHETAAAPASQTSTRETHSVPGLAAAAEPAHPDKSSAESPTVAPTPVKQKVSREEDLARLREMHEQDKQRRESDPAYRKAQDESRQRDAARTRADAMRVAKMTSEEVDGMFAMAYERQKRVDELVDTSYGRPADGVFAEMTLQEVDYQAQLRELIGAEKYERWQRYQDSIWARNEANDLQRQLARSRGEPMQPEQIDQLVEALYTEEQFRTEEYAQYVRSTGITDPAAVPSRGTEWQLAMGKAGNQRIHQAMAGSLTPGQMAELDEMLGKKIAHIEGAIRYNESLAKPR